jgi:uncharacterized protein (DUF924 family)
MNARAREIFEFWFGRLDDPGYDEVRGIWFDSRPAFDEEIRRRFKGDYDKAVAGDYDAWKNDPWACLCLVLLFDQFPRNMFRGTPKAFATDAHALKVASHAIQKGHDRDLRPVERYFYYLPFEHSERLEDQRRCVDLVRSLEEHPRREAWLNYAVRHLEVIEAFGRFPHRNATLGRTNTEAEDAYLSATDDRWVTKAHDVAETPD